MSNFAPKSKPVLRLARRNLLFLFAIVGLLGSLALIKLARRASADTTTAVSIPSFGTAVTQDFNTLVSTGTGTCCLP